MRVCVLAVALGLFLVGHILFVPSCYGQTATKGNPPKVSPVMQPSITPPFTPEQKEAIREIVTKETSAWESLVGTYLKIAVGILAIIVTIFIFGVTHAVKGIKRKVIAFAKEAETARDQAHNIVEELQTVRDNAERQAEEWSSDLQARSHQILADLGRPFANGPRYVLTQGGTITAPVWEFALILLGNGSVNSLLRLTGGARFDEEAEEQRRAWQECALTMHPNGSISLERHLSGHRAGLTQNFASNQGPTQVTINGITAIVWEGQWSGHSAQGTPGALIVYLD